jgi:hypothetical protein
MNNKTTALIITLALCGTVTFLYLNIVLNAKDLDIDLYDEEESNYY